MSHTSGRMKQHSLIIKCSKGEGKQILHMLLKNNGQSQEEGREVCNEKLYYALIYSQNILEFTSLNYSYVINVYLNNLVCLVSKFCTKMEMVCIYHYLLNEASIFIKKIEVNKENEFYNYKYWQVLEKAAFNAKSVTK